MASVETWNRLFVFVRPVAIATFTNILLAVFATKPTYNTRKPLNLILPAVHTARYMNSSFTGSSILWYSLPHLIENTNDKKIFKPAVSSTWQSLSYQTSYSFKNLNPPVKISPLSFTFFNKDIFYFFLFFIFNSNTVTSGYPLIRELYFHFPFNQKSEKFKFIENSVHLAPPALMVSGLSVGALRPHNRRPWVQSL